MSKWTLPLRLWNNNDLCYSIQGWFSNRTRTSVDDWKARGKDYTRLPVPNFPLCYWSSHLFDLGAPSSSDVPVLLLNQPIVWAARAQGGTSRSHTPNIVPVRLSERVWCTRFQSSLLNNNYLSLSWFQSSQRSKNVFTLAQNLSDMWLSTLENGAARRCFAPSQKWRRNHRSCGWIEALSGGDPAPIWKIVFCLAGETIGIVT